MLMLLAAFDISRVAAAITSSSWHVGRDALEVRDPYPILGTRSRYLHPWVLQGLCRGDPLPSVQCQQPLDQVNGW